MACRPVFKASIGSIGVETLAIEFKWYPGYSIKQKQKSIEDLHRNAKDRGVGNVLEVSSKSPSALGVQLSAFNLKTKTLKNNKEYSVESAFQSSKVFQRGGPYGDLLFADSRKAKKDARIKESGALVGFEFFNYTFPLEPKTFFYDWLYINVLLKNPNLIDDVLCYDSFSDIEFNPDKSVNCQAFSLAIFRTLEGIGMLTGDKIEPDAFFELAKPIYSKNMSISPSESDSWLGL